jgi:hypothetical protein
MILFMQNGTSQYADKVSKFELRTTVPAPLAIQSIKSKGGSCSTTGQTIHCDFGQLVEGERVEAAITVVPSEEGTFRFDVGWITDGACCIAMGPSLMVRIGGANHRPIAIGDLILIGTKKTASINVLKNDSDPDGDQIRILRWRTPASGTARCAGAICTYTKGSSFAGHDSFRYTITDGGGGTASARVKIRLCRQAAACNVHEKRSTCQKRLTVVFAITTGFSGPPDKHKCWRSVVRPSRKMHRGANRLPNCLQDSNGGASWAYNEAGSDASTRSRDRNAIAECFSVVAGPANVFVYFAMSLRVTWDTRGHEPPGAAISSRMLELYRGKPHQFEIVAPGAIQKWKSSYGGFAAIINIGGRGSNSEAANSVRTVCKLTHASTIGLYSGSAAEERNRLTSARLLAVYAALDECMQA